MISYVKVDKYSQKRPIQSKKKNLVKEDKSSQRRQVQLNPKGFSDAPVIDDNPSLKTTRH